VIRKDQRENTGRGPIPRLYERTKYILCENRNLLRKSRKKEVQFQDGQLKAGREYGPKEGLKSFGSPPRLLGSVRGEGILFFFVGEEKWRSGEVYPRKRDSGDDFKPQRAV